jgi:hypothetical protein
MDANTRLVDDMKEGSKTLGKDVKNMNTDLKKIVSKMRAPGKLCMDITLLIVLAVLTGTLIWAVRFYLSLDPTAV